MNTPLDFFDDARTIREWVNGGAVDIDRLLCELSDWENHFAVMACGHIGTIKADRTEEQA